ncbi:GRAM domain-containing protein 2B-like isoform X3 [Eupeodes corollae]|uniref:GRAM domain-containing protein 2B-like isoform X3 n=1 Tax=Eupeodes corollae TaxID=290404 RepID=UPI0024937F81|nr:GRAM domain-containing protein 2B-like isoform X3 [Eupeodes corollae]
MSTTNHDNSPRSSSVKSAPNEIEIEPGGAAGAKTTTSTEETLIKKCKSELDLVKNKSNLFFIKSYSFIDKTSKCKNQQNSDVSNLTELSKMISKPGISETETATGADLNYDDSLLLRRKSVGNNSEKQVRPKSLPSTGNVKRESFLKQSFQSIRRSFRKKPPTSSSSVVYSGVGSVMSSSSSGGSERTNCESDFEVVEVNGGNVRTRSHLGDLQEEEDESRTSKGSSFRGNKMAVKRSTSSVSTLSHSAPGSPMAPLQGHSETQSVNCLNNIGKNNSSPYTITQSSSTIPFTIGSKGDNKALRQTNSTPLPLVSSSANLRSLSPHSKVTIVSKNEVPEKEKKRKEVSSSRLKKFHRHFTQVSKDERVINYFSCALVSDILLQGHLYITDHHFAFYSNVFGYVTKVVIPTSSVTKISKEKVAKIIPNAVGVATADERHVFGSFLSRESAFRLMCSVCPTETPAPLIPKALPDVEISEEYSIEDDSSCSISGNESPPQILTAGRTATASEPSHTLLRRNTGGKGTRSDSPNAKNSSNATGGSTRTAPPSIPSTNSTSTTSTTKFNVVYLGVVLSLILAIFSGFLLYRIMDIEAKTSLYRSTVEFNWGSGNDADVFAEALRWQKELQSKSTEEAQNILHSNLQQIAKVRRSLETLSMLIHDRSSSSASKSEGNVDRDDTD